MQGFKPICIIFFAFVSINANGQTVTRKIDSFLHNFGIKVTIDYPVNFLKKRETIFVFYALPNGNTTNQTMGKKIKPGDDWHFDIQHIAAQTLFIRKQLRHKNFIVIYLENTLKSWPAWKQKHTDFRTIIPKLVDSVADIIPASVKSIYLSGHSGGGSFIFGYLDGVEKIPGFVKNISFIDSNYGYDSSYYPKLRQWLLENNDTRLSVFAYNDSVALYQGKPVVSATGGTWYRSHQMLSHLKKDFTMQRRQSDSFIVYLYSNNRLLFFLKKNSNRGIYHTQQVELNGFIHSVLYHTKYACRRYQYYGERAYTALIE